MQGSQDNMIRRVAGAAVLFSALSLFRFSALPTASAEPARGAQEVNFVEITPELRQSVEAGLAYLASIQSDDGSFDGSRYGRHVGITSLAVIAFLADGHVPNRGKYGDVVAKGSTSSSPTARSPA